jgi:hypothetical protein
MDSEFTFYDYVDFDGENVIRNWLYDPREVSKKARVKFQRGMLNLEGWAPPWPIRPFYAPLDEQCAGLFELRVPLDKQYRILGFHLDRTPTLVHCFVKRDAAVPPIECQRANEKKARVLADPAQRRVEHYYGK